MRIHRLLVLGATGAALVAGTAWAVPAPEGTSAQPVSVAGSADPGLPGVPAHDRDRQPALAGDQATVLDVARLAAGGASAMAVDPGPPPGATVIVVAARGQAPNTSTEPGRTQFEVPLYDVVTGEQVGRSTHDFVCDGFFSCEDTDTYYLPGGSIVSNARVSFNADGQRPGVVMTGAFPEERPLEGTGVFAGKTGSVRVNGWGDLSKMPAEMILDEIYVITYR